MAASICPKCGHSSFEMAKHKLTNAEKEVIFVQCAACGAVAGVVNEMEDILYKLNSILNELSNIQHKEVLKNNLFRE